MKMTRTELVVRREEVITQLGSQDKDVDAPSHRGDLGDLASDYERRDVQLDRRARLEKLLRELTLALERFDRGVYGICADCEEEIAPARLRAVPMAECCVACAATREREGNAHASRWPVDDHDE